MGIKADIRALRAEVRSLNLNEGVNGFGRAARYFADGDEAGAARSLAFIEQAARKAGELTKRARELEASDRS
ncbi:MAG: hypothetical protein DMF06_05125 [Verrucomicrobia bacterium]|nr:MAG: hypothetical protein DMF06_05125 [Verrucomicrobiota bacterium]